MVGKIPRFEVYGEDSVPVVKKEEDGQWVKYEDVDNCLKKSAEDEPVFVLVARDALAPAIVRYWAAVASNKGVPKEKWEEALACADAMDDWQRKHGSKLPD